MSFHLLAFWRLVDNTAGVSEITPVPDGIIATNPATGRFVLSRNGTILGAYLGALNANRGRLYTPWGLPNHIRPINDGGVVAGPDARIAHWATQPPRVQAGEDLIFDALHTAGVPRDVAGLAWLTTSGVEPAPKGERFTIRGDISGAAPVAFKWTQVTVSWEVALAPERYGIVGSSFFSSNAIGHRWILDSTNERPGALSVKTVGERPDDYGYGPALGLWGKFSGAAMPRLEVFDAAVDATGTVFLEVVRL